MQNEDGIKLFQNVTLAFVIHLIFDTVDFKKASEESSMPTFTLHFIHEAS